MRSRAESGVESAPYAVVSVVSVGSAVFLRCSWYYSWRAPWCVPGGLAGGLPLVPAAVGVGVGVSPSCWGLWRFLFPKLKGGDVSVFEMHATLM